MNQSKIEISRTNQVINFGRGINVFINDIKVGKLQNGESKTFNINYGINKIHARIDWCITKPLLIDIQKNDPVKLELGSNIKGWKLALGYSLHYYFIKRSEFLYLSLIGKRGKM
ncbi:MAG: hypothetical protein ACI9YL_000934 [Luteibaculaceae bacterium]|jgi:hypothetical protein